MLVLLIITIGLIDELLKSLLYIFRDVLSCQVTETDIDVLGNFLEIRVLLEDQKKVFNNLGKVYLDMILYLRVLVALDANVITTAIFILFMIRVELLWIRMNLYSTSWLKFRLLLNELDKLSDL